MPKLFGFGSELYAKNGLQTGFTRGGADGSVKLRSAQTMKKSAIHRSAVEHSQCAAVGIGKDGFAAELRRDLLETVRDLGERFIPGDALESSAELCSGRRAHASRGWSFRRNPLHWIQHAIGRVHAIQILSDFGAQKSASNRMGWIALYFGGTTVFHRY